MNTNSILGRRLARLGVAVLTLIMLFLALVGAGWAGTLLNANHRPIPTSYERGRPAIHAVPGSDGTSLMVAAGRLGRLETDVYGHVGGTSYERSHTMAYDSVGQEYVHTFEGVLVAQAADYGTIAITTTASTLGSSPFIRHYVPGPYPVDLPATDGWLNLHISANGVPTDTYVLIMPTAAPPGDPPAGHRLIGQAYALRASGLVTESLSPMVLRIGYEPAWLDGADPHTLSLFAWDADQRLWQDLGGTPFFSQTYLSLAVRRFDTYALMAAPTWRDTFSDLSGLAERQGTRVAYGGRLQLVGAATSGWAASVPITPTGRFLAWGRLTYSATLPAGTALTVSVLDGRTGEELLSNAADGADLAGLDPAAHPSLRLRADLSSAAPGQTPSLEEWAVSWTSPATWRQLYLPLFIRSPIPSDLSPIPSELSLDPSEFSPCLSEFSPCLFDLSLIRSDLSPGPSGFSPGLSDLSPINSDLSPTHSDLSPISSNLSPIPVALSPTRGGEHLSPGPSPFDELRAGSDRGGEINSPLPLQGRACPELVEGGVGGVRSVTCPPPTTHTLIWSPPANLSNNVGHSLAPALAADAAGTLHAAWYDNSAGNLDVYYARKPAGGNWSAPEVVASTSGGSYWPAIAVDRFGNVHVAWDDASAGREILYALKPAGASNWTAPLNISQSPGTSRFVALAADPAGNIHAVWNDDSPGNYEIYYTVRPPVTETRFLEETGFLWTTPINISNTPGASLMPAIAVDPSGGLHVAWHDYTPGTTEIFYVSKSNPAAAWSGPANVSRTTGTSYSPALAADSTGTVHVAWADAIVADYSAPFKVLYSQKRPGGSWTPYVNLSRDTGSAEMPALAAGPGDALHVAWNVTAAQPALLYVRRPAAEMGWTQPLTVATISAGAQYPAPALAADVAVARGRGSEATPPDLDEAAVVEVHSVIARGRSPEAISGNDDVGGAQDAVHLLWSDFGPLSQDILYSWTAPPPIPEDHVLVLDEAGLAVAGACVYRNSAPAVATDDTGVAVPQALAVGDLLAATQLMTQQLTIRQGHATSDSAGANWAYRIYLTSLDLDAAGNVHPYVVSRPGQQRLVVKRTSPLVLYNLLVSIEWDATLTYTQQISQASRLASDFLYDISDGQMAFGHVTIYDNGGYWADADVQISTRNSVRPYAYVGGLTADDRSQIIRLGRHWDGNVGRQGDWDRPNGFRTWIHEFGHYGLYLYDEYFGYVKAGGILLGEIAACCTDLEAQMPPTPAVNASIMDSQYTRTELADDGLPGLWSDYCQGTAQWQLNGASDWSTVTDHYTDTYGVFSHTFGRWQIVRPSQRGAVMPGPDAFPAAVLPFPEIELHNTGPDSPPRRLTVLAPDGRLYDTGALVALDTQRGGRLVTLDQGVTDPAGVIILYGAAAGNTVRGQTLDAAWSGQLTIGQAESYTLTLQPSQRMAAAAQGVTPYLSTIPHGDGTGLDLVLDGVGPGAAASAVVAPAGSALPVQTRLVYSPATGQYTGVVSFATPIQGIGGAYVRGVAAGGELITVDSDYSLLAVDATIENDLYSADGHLWLHLDRESAGRVNVYVALTPTGAVPQPLPAGRRVVGNAYAIRFSGSRSILEKPAVLKLFYPPDLAGGLAGLGIYRWDPAARMWEALGGELDAGQRSVAVRFDRVGIYALLAVEGTTRRAYLPIIAR